MTADFTTLDPVDTLILVSPPTPQQVDVESAVASMRRASCERPRLMSKYVAAISA